MKKIKTHLNISVVCTTQSCNAGQVKIEDAESLIMRLQSQETRPMFLWQKDFSPLMLESDSNKNKINSLSEGYCWVVCFSSTTSYALNHHKYPVPMSCLIIDTVKLNRIFSDIC